MGKKQFWWRSDKGEGCKNNERMRDVKDTIGALEDDAALYHLSHDAPHWPDVHWKQRTHTVTHKHTQIWHTQPHKNIMKPKIHRHQVYSKMTHEWGVVSVWMTNVEMQNTSCHCFAPPSRGAVLCCVQHTAHIFSLAFFALDSNRLQPSRPFSSPLLISLHSCCSIPRRPISVCEREYVLHSVGCSMFSL